MAERDEGYLQALNDLKSWHEGILDEARESGERGAHQKAIEFLNELIERKQSAKPEPAKT